MNQKREGARGKISETRGREDVNFSSEGVCSECKYFWKKKKNMKSSYMDTEPHLKWGEETCLGFFFLDKTNPPPLLGVGGGGLGALTTQQNKGLRS